MAIEQWSVINYGDIASISKYIKGSTLIPIDELESPIGLRVEGGGYIFYDDTKGCLDSDATPARKTVPAVAVPANALATRWGVEASYGTYKYDMLRGCVVRTAGTCNRFMVVDETDMVSSPYGSMLMWDTAEGKSTERSTNYQFGYGSANTTLLCSAITDATTIWPTVKYFRYRDPNKDSGAKDSATDTKWFVPSRDEIVTLARISSFYNYLRYAGDYILPRLHTPFWARYWTSSEASAESAWAGMFSQISLQALYYQKDLPDTNRVRLCRTF